METRICTICNGEKSLEDFPSNGNGGKRRQCKQCMREKNRRWRMENAERIATYNKIRRKTT